MLTPGTILQGRYRIIRQLGAGGMGAVYEAMDQRVNCLVAVKETFGGSDDYRRAFEREASLLANLRHPSLPKVMDHFVDDNGQFLVMEFITGHDLGELIRVRGQAFDTEVVMRWADVVLGALEYLHGRQPPVLHRDMKPANLKLTNEGELFLLDFGLAKGAAGEMPTAMQTSRSVLGYTPVYSPLEQIYGQGTDPRSDIYALAATLYHLLTGVAPIDAATRFLAVDEDQPDPLLAAEAWTSHPARRVTRVIERALALRRKERIASAAEFRQALRAARAASAVTPAPAFHATDAAPNPTVAGLTIASDPLVGTGKPSASSTGYPTGTLPAAVQSGAQQLLLAPAGQRSNLKLVGIIIAVVFGLGLLIGGIIWFIGSGTSTDASNTNVAARRDSSPVNTNSNSPVAPGSLPGEENNNGPASENRSGNQYGIEFVPIAPGSFMMGSPAGEAGRFDVEGPQHQVTISRGFYLGKYEVTQGQWTTVMRNNPSKFAGCDRCPVEQVSWEDAQLFIAKLNALNDGFVYRLPTEAEWEYAARAGTSGPYAGNLDAMAWYGANSGGKTHPVGTKSPNAWGLYDMHGNVFEWVQDWYGNFSAGLQTDPTGPTTGSDRCYHGGGWDYPARYARAAGRYRYAAGYRTTLGFRVVRTLR